MAAIPVSKKTVKTFADALKFYLTVTGLGDWEIVFKQQDITDMGSAALATVACDLENCFAEVSIALTWPDSEEQSAENIRKIALHEVLHILLARYDSLAQSRHVTPQQLAEAEHDVIRRLVMLCSELQTKKRGRQS